MALSDDRRVSKDKYSMNDFKKYKNSGGFGNIESETKQDKLEKKRQRDDYAKSIRDRNSSKASTTNGSTSTGYSRYSSVFER